MMKLNVQIVQFNLWEVRAKNNLWFGMTSKKFGTATSENLAKESQFLDQTHIINEYKKRLREKEHIEEEKPSKKKVGKEQIIIQMPERMG